MAPELHLHMAPEEHAHAWPQKHMHTHSPRSTYTHGPRSTYTHGPRSTCTHIAQEVYAHMVPEAHLHMAPEAYAHAWPQHMHTHGLRSTCTHGPRITSTHGPRSTCTRMVLKWVEEIFLFDSFCFPNYKMHYAVEKKHTYGPAKHSIAMRQRRLCSCKSSLFSVGHEQPTKVKHSSKQTKRWKGHKVANLHHRAQLKTFKIQ